MSQLFCDFFECRPQLLATLRVVNASFTSIQLHHAVDSVFQFMSIKAQITSVLFICLPDAAPFQLCDVQIFIIFKFYQKMHFFDVVGVSAHSGYVVGVWWSFFVSPDVDRVNNFENFAAESFNKFARQMCISRKSDTLLVFKLYVAWTVFGCAP